MHTGHRSDGRGSHEGSRESVSARGASSLAQLDLVRFSGTTGWCGLDLVQIAFKNSVACVAAITRAGCSSKFPQRARVAFDHAGEQLTFGDFAASADDASSRDVQRPFGGLCSNGLSGFNHLRSSILRASHARLPLRLSV